MSAPSRSDDIFALKYRPEIDGLRALAVLAVVLFHAGLGFPGGYVGVDVFFVISGYLITSLILKDLMAGRFSLKHFWVRRIRRILPPLVVVTLGAVAAGWFLLLPSDYAELAESALWQIAVAANVFFWLNTGYFAGPADEMPLLHTWSLAVEEQFYFVLPLLLIGIWALRDRKALSLTRILIAVALVAGLALSAYMVVAHRSAAFYLLPSRGWELSLGALLAVLPRHALSDRRITCEIVSFTGLVLLMASTILYDASTPFPGVAALAPCLGTAAIIWSFSSAAGSTVGRILSSAPLVYVGLISYSLYLWHWPILVYAKYWQISEPTLTFKLAAVAASFAAAFASYRLVEQPIRHKRMLKTDGALLGTMSAALAGVALASAFVLLSGGATGRFDPTVEAFAAAADEMEFMDNATAEDLRADRLLPIGAPGERVQALVWGDSHAKAMMPAFDDVFRRMGIHARRATHSATAPLVGFFRQSGLGLREGGEEHNEEVLKYVVRNKVRHVFIVAYWDFYASEPTASEKGRMAEQLPQTVRELAAAGAQAWVVLDVPEHPVDVPKALARGAIFGRDADEFAAPVVPSNDATLDELAKGVADSGGIVLDPKKIFLNQRGDHYVMQRDGRALYRDAHHITPFAAREIVAPYLQQAVQARMSIER